MLSDQEFALCKRCQITKSQNSHDPPVRYNNMKYLDVDTSEQNDILKTIFANGVQKLNTSQVVIVANNRYRITVLSKWGKKIIFNQEYLHMEHSGSFCKLCPVYYRYVKVITY
jgi:hypothetical protein